MCLITTLAAAPNDQTETIAALTIGLLAAIAAGIWFGVAERKKRNEVEQRLGAAYHQRRQQDSDSSEREALMFDQHKRMNELQIAKLAAEVELLQHQVKSKAVDDDRVEASKEYHELMVEKTRLEMDSLRLHLLELRKRARTEDWRSDE